MLAHTFLSILISLSFNGVPFRRAKRTCFFSLFSWKTDSARVLNIKSLLNLDIIHTVHLTCTVSHPIALPIPLALQQIKMWFNRSEIESCYRCVKMLLSYSNIKGWKRYKSQQLKTSFDCWIHKNVYVNIKQIVIYIIFNDLGKIERDGIGPELAGFHIVAKTSNSLNSNNLIHKFEQNHRMKSSGGVRLCCIQRRMRTGVFSKHFSRLLRLWSEFCCYLLIHQTPRTQLCNWNGRK